MLEVEAALENCAGHTEADSFTLVEGCFQGDSDETFLKWGSAKQSLLMTPTIERILLVS